MLRIRAVAAMVAVAAALGCGGDEATRADAERGPRGGAAQASAVPLTGNVIEVLMVSGRGELFEPNEIVAQRGDVLRFKLAAGVHNVSFPADRNPRGVKLPEASPFLQLPGQTHDITVDLPAGSYFFQCDPHVLLGMTGTLTVRD
jgi:plastocyanin